MTQIIVTWEVYLEIRILEKINQLKIMDQTIVKMQRIREISITTCAQIVENVPDQNTAGGHINTNYYGGIGDPDYYGHSYGNKYNGKYFGKDVEDFLINRKLSDVEKLQRSRGLYEHYEYDDGNPDVHGRIQRPCQAYDTFCIRKFFAQHSQCKISGREVPEPLFRAQATLNIPNSNVSAIFNNLEYRGIKDGRVAEFYIDKETDNLVIAVDFDQVTFGSQTLYLKYYLRGREPVVVQDAAGATFVQVSVTAVIPNLKNLKLDRAEIYTYNGEPVPPFLAGPRLALSTDPEVVTMFATAIANVPTDAQESLMTEGVFYILNFIQYNICDFGLKVI
ncbi:uncharacterized protein LOC134670454 [Cydia fagiglandana]|uniref:uncharacterized protein LOC134670454 n=1 Tax=Cydia fagiglandana TaxID=1458189 RepID=UPI002FEE0FAD